MFTNTANLEYWNGAVKMVVCVHHKLWTCWQTTLIDLDLSWKQCQKTP